MAAKNMESLVLRGVSVLGGGKAVELCLGSYVADVQMPRGPLSMRHPSPGCEEDRTEPPQQRIRNRRNGADRAAVRAGRPGSPAGVLVRRNPARKAGRAVLFGWPIAAGATPPFTVRSTTRATAGVGTILPGRLSTLFAGAHASRLWPQERSSAKRQEVDQARLVPACGTLAISTRGTGD